MTDGGGMELGFETIGNATLVCHDAGPRLVTDPWVRGDAYFGSWTLSHEIPDAQRAAIAAAPYAWFSHGHPDHLSWGSLSELHPDVVCLLPDHVGGRIAGALRAAGRRVQVLPDRRWVELSPRIRVCCIADLNQDGVLLVDVGGALVVDLNDASDHGWRTFVRREVRRFDRSFHLHIAPWGEADMCNVFDEDGRRIPRFAHKRPVGETVAAEAEAIGARFAVPFSSQHRYQRTDSVWANDHLVGLDDWADGFASARVELLPAFLRYDVRRDEVTEIAPPPTAPATFAPESFGDVWSDALAADEADEVEGYVRRFEHVADHFSSITFRVGGEERVIGLRGGPGRPAVTFEAPRASLLAAVRHEIFDDLLIGNFMRTELHGTTDPAALYPDFTPYVGKYGDNGGAHSADELRAYFAEYRRRAPLDVLRHQLEQRSMQAVRRVLPEGSVARDVLRRGHGSALRRGPTRRSGGRPTAPR